MEKILVKARKPWGQMDFFSFLTRKESFYVHMHDKNNEKYK